jgi:hypothetical protein
MGIIRESRHFEGTRDAARPMERISNVREAAKDFRRELLAQSKVLFYRSFELVRVPYPTKYAYLNAFSSFSPYLHLVNRLFVIQFQSAEGIKILLVSPSDWEHQKETPFFTRLGKKSGPFESVVERLIFRKTNTVLNCLASIGLCPSDIDYITYDHLHTQRVTRWLGDDDQPLIPWQNQWYCPDGIKRVPADKVVLLDRDVFLGEGVALVRTKGHTEGNHSIVASTDGGVHVSSENGVSLDAYAPLHSRVPGVAEFARYTGAEVILNGNTVEYGVDQYISMIQEKEIAGPSPRFDGYPNMAPSSEAQGHWLFPRTHPTVSVGDLHYGTLQAPTRA